MNRDKREQAAKEQFLLTGKVPVSYALTQGLKSLVRDPFLLIVMQMPGPLGFKLRQLWFSTQVASMGRGVIIDQGIHVPYLSNLHLSDFCFLNFGLRIYAPEGYVKIGKRSHIGGWILGHEGVEIGDYASSAGMLLSITDGHHKGHRMTGPMVPLEQRNLKRGKVTLGKDSFVGQHSIVMPGVTIGEGAVVGPFSVVVRDVPAWTVVSGNPAVKIGMREPVRFPDPD